MKNLFLFSVLVCNTGLFAQGVFTITTNKPEYSYGEIIKVSVSIFNNTDSTILFHPECVYPVWVRVKGVKFLEEHSLADFCERVMEPGEKETWDFQLNPSKLGIPVSNGEQIIYADGYNHLDSVSIKAPKYYGGIIRVRFDYIVEKEKRDKFFNIANATVIKSDTLLDVQQVQELWSVRDISIDSLIHELFINENDFGYVDTYRLFEQGIKTVTAISDQLSTPLDYILSQNYPNPFNPETTIKYKIPEAMHVKICVYNPIGEHIVTLEDKYQSSGTHEVILKSDGLASGIYYYQLVANSKIITKKLVLLK